jgi:hypothetical protein
MKPIEQILTVQSNTVIEMPNSKGLFDHRTNRRAHRSPGSNPRG